MQGNPTFFSLFIIHYTFIYLKSIQKKDDSSFVYGSSNGNRGDHNHVVSLTLEELDHDGFGPFEARLHYYVKELWLLRKSLKATRDSNAIQHVNKNKRTLSD
ncbi:hypothetical protein L1987_74016 [Smallanthus sonchifolius]|uniref:Uncharacterized protein n=1 Tax=Smallanthus sonchifolius TaxID=185202 RepID=A0ACB9A1F5_9ASTR|nr:hypothetical protein L1987_74016 [Smallanthus sonchifolius]